MVEVEVAVELEVAVTVGAPKSVWTAFRSVSIWATPAEFRPLQTLIPFRLYTCIPFYL